MGVTVNAFWHGAPLNPLLWACMRSFVCRGHAYRLHVYAPVPVPEGVTLVDAEQVLPRSQMFHIQNRFTGRPDIGPFSDLFRYKLLMDEGGWYVDVDTVSMSSELPDGIRAWAQENEKVERKVVINGAQLALPKGDPLARLLYKKCVAIGTESPLREDWGPNLLTATLPSLGLPANMFGTTASFYPIDWISAFILMMPGHSDDVRTKANNALFLAAYQSFFQYCGINLSRMPPAGSYFASLYKEFVPEHMRPLPYTTEEVLARVRTFFQSNGSWAVEQLVNSMGDQILDEIGVERP